MEIQDQEGASGNARHRDSGIDEIISLPSGETTAVQYKYRGLSRQAREVLFRESRNQCGICGSRAYLETAAIKAMYLGGSSTPENMIVLCPTCHRVVDTFLRDENVLRKIKQDWVEKSILGATYVNQFLSAKGKIDYTPSAPAFPSGAIRMELLHWVDTVQAGKTFDAEMKEVQTRLEALKNEDEFLSSILRPLIVSLGFERVRVIHHTGAQERGKDMVFYQRDQLGSFTAYAVVACCKRIHTNSAKTGDAGHYAKLLDQVRKCYNNPWRDPDLKRDTFIDKVVVATPFTISDEAVGEFLSWEEMNRRQLIYLDSERLIGLLTGLRLDKDRGK